MYCPSCGARNSDDAKFCNQCGVRIASMAPVGGGADAPAVPSHAGTAPSPSPRAPVATPTPAPAPTAPLGPGAGGGTLVGVPVGGAVPSAPAPAPGMAPRTPTVPVMEAGGMPVETPPPGAAPEPGAPLPARLPTMGGTGDSIALPMAGPSKRTMAIAGVGIALAGIGLGALMAWRAFKQPAQTEQQTPVPETGVALVERPTVIGQGDAGAEETEDDTAAPATGARGGRGSGARGGNGAAASGAGGTTQASAGARQRPGTTQASAGGGGSTQASAGGGTQTNAGGSRAGGGGTQANAGAGGGGTQANAGGGTQAGAGGGGTQANAGGGETAGGGSGGSGSGGGTVDEPTGVQAHAPGGGGGYTQGEQTDATGRMDPSVFQFVYQHYRSQIASCHSMVSRQQDVIGTMRLRVRLATDGHVASTRVLRNTTNNDQLAQCVQNQVRNWRYPQPDGGEVEFDYNFGFGQ